MKCDLLHPDPSSERMKYKFKRLIQGPNAQMLEVRCKCKGSKFVYSHSSHEIKCDKCHKVLLRPTAGKAKKTSQVESYREVQ